MTDPFPAWPSAWLEDHTVAAEEVVAADHGVELVSALRNDGQVLLSVRWPGGRRYMLVDPVGGGVPLALRSGEKAEDAEAARLVEGLWSQALTLAKRLIDGEDLLPPEPPEGKRRRFGFGR